MVLDKAERRQTLSRPKSSVVKEHIRGRFFAEARPVQGTTYFPATSSSDVAVVVCLYNEVGPELSRTIESLAGSGVALDVVVVADGLAKLSDSMRLFLTKTFKLQECTAILHAESHVWQGNDQIFISDPVVLGSNGSTFSVLLKRFNHKKINTVRRSCKCDRHVT